MRCHQELDILQALLPEGIHFDAANGVQILRYLEPYGDLRAFYASNHQFSTKIATALGITLATLHQATFQRQDYRLELDPHTDGLAAEDDDAPDFRSDLESLTPALFKKISADGLKFYKLYQRSDSLAKAIGQLESDYQACCLIHNDLKFSNILLHHDWLLWQPSHLPASAAGLRLSDGQGIVRVIDWEQWEWGDPALDLGALVADYLRLWLKSLMLSRDLDLEVALRLAAVPLQTLQPSLGALLQAYLAQFPAILELFPAFPERVLRFAGLGLIGAIQDRLHYREPFGNVEISMLQVARSLLCQPQAAMATIFGRTDFQPSGFDPRAVDSGPTTFRAPGQTDNSRAPEQTQPHWANHDFGADVLTDLIANIGIEPPLIRHPAFESLDLSHPGDAVKSKQALARFSALPSQLSQAYLLRQVRNYLYDIYFSGQQERVGSSSSETKEFINNTVAGLDVDFYGRIQAANSGTGFWDPDWTVIRSAGERIQVEKDDLRLWVDPTLDLALDPASRGLLPKPHTLSSLRVGAAVLLRLPNAYLIGDYYMAIGNQGKPASDQTCINLFFNTIADGAVILMTILTRALNRQDCSFTFKVVNEPLTGQPGSLRFDAAVLCLQSTHYQHLRLVLQENYSSYQPFLRTPIPLFALPLAPGIGLAESPAGEHDFGLDRCQMLAEALLASDPTPASRQRAIQQSFAQHRLDWLRPHLNPDSTARYPPLDVA